MLAAQRSGGKTRERARRCRQGGGRVSRTGTAAGRDATARDTAAREVAARMAAAAAAWLDALSLGQRAVASGGAPSPDAGSDAERRRWFYTPTDHGGLTLGAQRPAQQRLAHQLVATGLSTAGYVTVATIISLNNVVVDGMVRSTTPCFFGADPAVSPLLGPAPLRPLGGAEVLARDLVRSLDPGQAARAILLDRAPSDIVGGNRARLSDGDQVIHLRDIWRGQFTERRLAERVTQMGDGAELASGYDARDHQRVALTSVPKGLPAAELGYDVLGAHLTAHHL